MSSWLSPIRKILDAETDDLRALAELVGGNPNIFYVGVDLSKCNLKGQDLRGMNFTGSLLSASSMDLETRIDPEFDPRFDFKMPYIQIGMRDEILALALAFADEVRYRYKAWALKALLEVGINYLSDREVRHVIDTNQGLNALDSIQARRMRRLTLQVYPYIQEAAHEMAFSKGEVYNRDTYNGIVLAGLVRQFIARNSAKDYATIDPLDMFDGARFYLEQIRRGKRFVR